jgi:quercetin dioxygenase-like cupin family protein
MLIVKISQVKTGAGDPMVAKKFQVKGRQNLMLNQENKGLRLIQPGLIQPGEGRRLAIPGGIITIKATGEDTGGTYAMIEMLVPPQSGPPTHVHSREIESFYILEGSLSFWLSDRKFTGSAGCLVIAPPGNTHAFKNEGDEPARVLLLITPAGLEEFFQEVGVPIKAKSALSEYFTPENLERMVTTASKYGVETKLP